MTFNKSFFYFFIKLLFLFGIIYFVIKYLDDKEKEENYFDQLIVNTAERHGADWHMIKAIIKQESKFKKDAVGTVGEIGLMQITKNALRDWERVNKVRYHFESELFYPELNIEVGTWYFIKSKQRWKDYSNPDAYALAEYNAGRRNVLKWMENKEKSTNIINAIEFPSTKSYVISVLKIYKQYSLEKKYKMRNTKDLP